MYNLHFNIMKWIYDNSKYTQGIEYILYAGWENGRGPGLQQWKKKLLWAPFYMIVGSNRLRAARFAARKSPAAQGRRKAATRKNPGEP